MNKVGAYTSIEELAKAEGISVRKRSADWIKAKQERFLKCPRCGNQMKRIAGTNVILCEGVKDEQPCNYKKILDEQSVSYAEFLFG